jgi:tetratricopeptide (TPR) repeat protein
LDHGAEINAVRWEMDYSKARNLLLRDGMNLMIEPWEYLAKGHEEISACEENSNINVIRGMSASKELRIWKGLSFKNPVYETLDGDTDNLLHGVAILSTGGPDRRQEALEICSAWVERRPTSTEPWYYSAFTYLSLGMYEKFMSSAERYLAMSKSFGPAEVQVTYRMSRYLAQKGEMKKAAGCVAKCLARHPTFAEFWCLFGDLFLRQKQYAKARLMYANAMDIGARRSNSDSHPIEIEKYGYYPKKMMDMIDEMDKNTEMIVRLEPK